MIGQYTIGHNSLQDPSFNLPVDVWKKLVYSNKDPQLSNKALLHPNCPRSIVEEFLLYYVSPTLDGDSHDCWKVSSALRSPNISNDFFNKILLKTLGYTNFLKDPLLHQLFIGWIYDDRITGETIDKAISLLSHKESTITNFYLDERKNAILRALMDNPNIDDGKAIEIRRQMGQISKEDPDPAGRTAVRPFCSKPLSRRWSGLRKAGARIKATWW